MRWGELRRGDVTLGEMQENGNDDDDDNNDDGCVCVWRDSRMLTMSSCATRSSREDGLYFSTQGSVCRAASRCARRARAAALVDAETSDTSGSVIFPFPFPFPLPFPFPSPWKIRSHRQAQARHQVVSFDVRSLAFVTSKRFRFVM